MYALVVRFTCYCHLVVCRGISVFNRHLITKNVLNVINRTIFITVGLPCNSSKASCWRTKLWYIPSPENSTICFKEKVRTDIRATFWSWNDRNSLLPFSVNFSDESCSITTIFAAVRPGGVAKIGALKGHACQNVFVHTHESAVLALPEILFVTCTALRRWSGLLWLFDVVEVNRLLVSLCYSVDRYCYTQGYSKIWD